MEDNEHIHQAVHENYTRIAQQESGQGCCGGSGGCGCSSSATAAAPGYSEQELSSVPTEADLGLGCGNPVALAGLTEGETVLDLGCGGGLDCFLASRQVGASGHVIGVDMTYDMIQRARLNAETGGMTNVEFRLGEIEHLPVRDASVDAIISNCVINLSPDKQQVFHEAYRVLKPGGRISISDILATAELPETLRQDVAMLVGCVAGAQRVETTQKMLQQAGFVSVSMTKKDGSDELLESWAPG
ncbi:MAG: arsenite methyltransferase, partial [Spirochaetota bacterium]